MRIHLLLLFISFSVLSIAQTKYDAKLINRIHNNPNDEQVYSFLVKLADTKSFSVDNGLRVVYQVKDIAVVSGTIKNIQSLEQFPAVKRVELVEPHLKPMNDTMVVRNRIKPVKQGMAPLTQAYDGDGVIIGIIDTGIDFSHPDFKDANGNTRIKYIWDQTILNGATPPSPFNYGQEWTAAQIDANQCTHTDAPRFGHGTHVSGIAAGDGSALGRYEGVAPKVEIIFVALDFNSYGPVIGDAVQYIVTKAQQLGKPFVINASVGGQYGSHDGTDSEAQLIDNLIANIPGRAMVASAGNDGDEKLHVQFNTTATDTNFTWLYESNSNVSRIDYLMYADTAQIKNVKLSIAVNNPNDLSKVGQTPFHAYNYALNTLKRDTIYNTGGNRIGIIESTSSINTFGVYELYIAIKRDSAGYVWSVDATGNGKFDSWGYNFVSAPFLPTPLEYPAIVKYVLPDTFQTIVSSFQCSDEIITVANYVNLNQYYDYNNVLQSTGGVVGAKAASSSIGPTRDGRIKPDVAASGESTLSTWVLSLVPDAIANYPSLLAQGGQHVIGGGTSSSAPVVAGLVALYLQANPTATNQQIKQAITNCAYQDQFTGSSLPNIAWGYGKLDGLGTFTCNLTTGVAKNVSQSEGLLIYPVPSSDKLHIVFKQPIKQGDLQVFDVNGKLVHQSVINNIEYVFDKKNLQSGIYFIQVITDTKEVFKQKIIFQD